MRRDEPAGGSTSSTIPGASPPEEPDLMAMLRQFLGGDVAGSSPDAATPASVFGGAGGPNATGMQALFGMMGGGKKQNASDAFFTDRIPLLRKAKRPLVAAFFGFAFKQGWVGKWGALQGVLSTSYFDVLGVPLRVVPASPMYGKAFFMTQVYVDMGFRLVGFLLNWAKGKTSPAEMFKPPPGAPPQPWAAGDAQPSPFDTPAARTTSSPAWEERPASGTSPPIIDV